MLQVLGFCLLFGSVATEQLRPQKPKIVDGSPVDAGVYPWIASLYIGDNDCDGNGWVRTYHFCGGSVFDVGTHTWLLTAAHCLLDIEAAIEQLNDDYAYYYNCKFHLFADITRDDADDWYETGFETIEIDDYKLHENYSTDTFANDIAVAWSKDSVTVDPVTLQPSTPCCTADAQVRVIGYGLDYEDGEPTPTLEYVDLKYVEWDTCKAMLDMLNTNYSASDDLRDGMFCAYDVGQSACYGDAGAPMIQGTTSGSPQVGVVSWGYGCAVYGAPNIFTDVGYYYDWIQETKENNRGSVASFLVAIAVVLCVALY